MGILHLNPVALSEIRGSPLNQGCVELDHFAAPQAHEVVVRAISRGLVMAVVLTEGMLLDQPQLPQYAHRAVDRCQADVRVLEFDPIVDGLGIEVPIARLEYLKHEASLAS